MDSKVNSLSSIRTSAGLRPLSCKLKILKDGCRALAIGCSAISQENERIQILNMPLHHQLSIFKFKKGYKDEIEVGD